jgi:hypothetical protein
VKMSLRIALVDRLKMSVKIKVVKGEMCAQDKGWSQERKNATGVDK